MKTESARQAGWGEEEGGIAESAAASPHERAQVRRPAWEGGDDTEADEMPEEEKADLRLDFERLMRERFLAGFDDFDYAIVDNDDRLDDLDIASACTFIETLRSI